MGRIFVFASLIAIVSVAAYAIIAMRGDNSTNTLVKLLGPGMSPSQCEERIRPHFEKIEPAMTKIAEELLNSDKFNELRLAFGENGTFLVTKSATGKVIEVSSDEVDFDPKHFEKLKDAGYYAPGQFRKTDDKVSAPTTANCGVPLYQWMRLRLGLGWTKDSQRIPVAMTSYRYDRKGFGEIDQCPTSVTDPDPTVFCQIRLTGNWLWALEYYDFEQIQSMQNESQ